MSTVQSWSVKFLTLGMKSYVFNNKFLSLTSKQRTPQFRMRNRGVLKKSVLKISEGKKTQENHCNSWVLASHFHPQPEEFYAHLPRFPCCLQLPILQRRGRALGCSSWGRGARGVKDALQPWQPKTLPEHPHQRALAILLCCTCRNGGSCLEKPRFLASCSIYTSENSATSQKSGVDTNNVFSYRKQNQLFSFN